MLDICHPLYGTFFLLNQRVLSLVTEGVYAIVALRLLQTAHVAPEIFSTEDHCFRRHVLNGTFYGSELNG